MVGWLTVGGKVENKTIENEMKLKRLKQWLKNGKVIHVVNIYSNEI